MNEHHYAGFWRRVAAFSIDGLFLLIPQMLMHAFIPFSGWLLFAVYKPVFEASAVRATPGKRIMGIQVITQGGGRMSNKQALARFFFGWISGFLLFAGHIFMLFSDRKQTLYDRVCETFVVHGKSDGDMVDAWVAQLRTWWWKSNA